MCSCVCASPNESSDQRAQGKDSLIDQRPNHEIVCEQTKRTGGNHLQALVQILLFNTGLCHQLANGALELVDPATHLVNAREDGVRHLFESALHLLKQVCTKMVKSWVFCGSASSPAALCRYPHVSHSFQLCGRECHHDLLGIENSQINYCPPKPKTPLQFNFAQRQHSIFSADF